MTAGRIQPLPLRSRAPAPPRLVSGLQDAAAMSPSARGPIAWGRATFERKAVGGALHLRVRIPRATGDLSWARITNDHHEELDAIRAVHIGSDARGKTLEVVADVARLTDRAHLIWTAPYARDGDFPWQPVPLAALEHASEEARRWCRASRLVGADLLVLRRRAAAIRARRTSIQSVVHDAAAVARSMTDAEGERAREIVAQITVSILRAAGVPSRLVLCIPSGGSDRLSCSVEHWIPGDRWQPIDPTLERRLVHRCVPVAIADEDVTLASQLDRFVEEVLRDDVGPRAAVIERHVAFAEASRG